MIAHKLKTLENCVLELDNSTKHRRHLFSTVFGINDLVAIIFQSILTRVVADKNGLFALDVESQVIFNLSYLIFEN